MTPPARLPVAVPRLPIPATETYPVVVRAGRRTILAAEPAEIVEARGSEALRALDDLRPGWWAGFLGYDLGRAVEHVVPRANDDLGLPDLLLARYDARLVTGPGGTRWEGPAAARERLLRLVESSSAPEPGPTLGPPTSSLERPAFEAGVRSVVDLITAGDCYQANLARRITWDGQPDPGWLFAQLAVRNPAPHGSLFVLPRPDGDPVAVVSASPERFLRWRGRSVETRPIKGTARDAAWLRASAKDRAENVMIVDLARNDLGRVCSPGSITVPTLCGIEAHPGLHHLVSTVRGRMRDEVGVGELIRATFPPASVTGAPKPRVLQVIEDLEPVRRGVYCGAVGWLDTRSGAGDLAVAIRTFTMTDGRTHLGVGSGIVADSDPRAEWEETELKASRLVATVGAHHTRRRSAVTARR